MQLMTLMFPAAALVAALISLISLAPLTHALTTHELDQFPRGDGTNKTVSITDNGDGTLTFAVYRGCKRDDSDNNEPGSGDEPDTPDLLPPGDPETGGDPAKLRSPLVRVDRREDENCTSQHAISITVFKSPIINQQPVCVPRPAIVAFSVKGFPLFNRFPGFGRGGRRGGRKGGRRGGRRGGHRGGSRGGNRGRSGSRGGRGKRDATRTDEYIAMRDRPEKIVGQDELMGVTVDGFPIYSANSSDVADRLLNASDLDQCGGRCGSDGSYRYHVVPGRPLLLGCIKGQLAEPLPTPASRPHRSQDEEDDEEDESDEDSEQCSFFISCSAAESAGSCDASQPVSADNYTCTDFDEGKHGRSSQESSDEDRSRRGKSNSHESSDEDSSRRGRPSSYESSDEDKSRRGRPSSHESSDEDRSRRGRPSSYKSSDEDRSRRGRPGQGRGSSMVPGSRGMGEGRGSMESEAAEDRSEQEARGRPGTSFRRRGGRGRGRN